VGKEVPASTEGLSPGESPEEREPQPADRDSAAALVRATAGMAVGTALSRLTGFGRVAAMAFALGVAESRLSDAYNVANNIPNIVYELILGGILTSVFVPVFIRQLTKRSEEQAWRSAQAVITVTFIVLAAVTLVGILAAPWIVRLYTVRIPGAEERAAVQELATLFLRFFMPQILMYGVGAVATGLLNARRRFTVPMFAPILNNLIVIGTFIAFAMMPGPAEPTPETITLAQKLVLAIGTTGGVLAMTLALWPSLRRAGFRWRWRPEFRNEAVRALVGLSGWAVLYVVFNQLGLLVVIVLAGEVTGGYASYLAAFILFQLPHAIFSVSIMTALLPSLSESWARGEVQGFRSSLARGIRISALVVLPAAAGYLALSRPIVRLLLEHGVAGAESSALVSRVLAFFAIGLFSFSAFMLFLRAFYAMSDTRTPALVNVFAVGINTVANLALFPVLGVPGLALGHAIAYTFAAITSATILRRRLGGLEGRALARSMIKIFVAAAATGGAAWLVSWLAGRALDPSTIGGQAAQVGLGVVAGLVAFALTAVALRIGEFDLLKRMVRGRLRR
jgi:putative peptidoglycan lipid II flippase